jgi:general secretion pathway protein E
MGVEAYQLSAGLLGGAAQRLMRRLCPHCSRSRPITEAERSFVLAVGVDPPSHGWDAAGCNACANAGFSGRVAVLEAFLASDALSSLIARRASLSELQAQASSDGLNGMLLDGVAKAIAGQTTFGEVMAMVQT